MRVWGVQLDIAWEDKAANHAKVRALLGAAAVAPGSLIVLPEMFSTGFSMNVAGIAEGPGGATEGFLSALAKEKGCTVVGGVVTSQADGKGRNEAAVYGPDGAPGARYAKIHPFSFAGETDHYAQGSETVVFGWAGAKVTPFVCYDLRFPEVFRNAVGKGAQVVVVIANWPEGRDEHWRALLRARAIENLAYVVGVNRCGRDPKLAYAGRSQVIDPKGNVLTDAGSSETAFGAEIDLAGLEAWRREFPALRDMRGGWV